MITSMFRPSPHLGQSGVGGGTGVMDTSCVRVAQFLYRKFERIRASAERERRSQWHHAVAEESESLRTVLQCSGHPISHSTNSGFKRRCEFGALGVSITVATWSFRFAHPCVVPCRASLFTCPAALSCSCGVIQSRCEFGALGEDGGPGPSISRARRKNTSASWSRATLRRPFLLPPLQSRHIGVGHCSACSAIVT